MGLKQLISVLMTLFSFLTLVEFGNGEEELDLSSDLRHVSSLVKFLTHGIYVENHLNIVHDHVGMTPCLDQLFFLILEEKQVRKTVSIGNPLKNSSHPHHFTSWNWIHFLLVDGRVGEMDFQDLTSHIRSRAIDSFFTDFTLIWQWTNFNPQLLESPLLEKLKFKGEVEVGMGFIYISSICFYCNMGNPIRTLVTTSSTTSLLGDTNDVIFPDFTQSFHGRVLRVTGGVGIPLLMTFKQVDGVWKPWSGFLIDPILFHVQDKMNFSMSTRVFKTFGSLENGSFTGFVNEIYEGRSDIGMAGQSYDRIQGVHFSDSIHIDSVSFATAVPDSGIKWEGVFRAFTWDTWLLLLALCFLIIMPLYFWLGKWGHWINSSKSPSWSDGIGFIYRPVIEQGLTPGLIPSSDSGRVLMIFWLCMVLVLSVAYRSKLTSLMVYPETEQVPDSFEMLADSKYKIILHHVGGALYKNIQSTTSPTFQRIGRRLTLESSIYKCLQRAALEKRTACVSYIHNLIGEIYRNFTHSNGVSTLRMAGTNVFMTAGSYFLPKSAVYRESINYVVAHQIAFGFSKYALDKAFQTPLDEGKLWAREEGKGGEGEQGPKSLRMTHMKAPFFLLFTGIGIGMALFSTEKYWGRGKGIQRAVGPWSKETRFF